MHFTPVAILLQLTLCAVVYGRFWGSDFKRQNDELTRDRRRSPPITKPKRPCSAYHNIDQICPFSAFPKVAQVIYNRDLEDTLTIFREAPLADICTDASGWLECIQTVYKDLSDDCRAKYDRLPAQEQALVGLLKFTDDLCVDEIRNTLKHRSCFANSSLIREASRCFGTLGEKKCELDTLYKCVGDTIEEADHCKAGAAAFLERVTRPLFDAFRVCSADNNAPPAADSQDFAATVLRSMNELAHKKKTVQDFFKN